ncbi:hypothetical protein [Nocardia phage NBR1]|uniref:hypothetical protein n=1 Tax=Nocardia phage NBR1 TaxID=1109711 RepID=UPI00023EEE01|nr:hypothetical protein NoPhNBR1_gp62 [Nocardia phage NBR1]AEV52275.1 hypothetical protein [Nocardia phage NBR1]
MTTIQGILAGQRCARCKGAVRWQNAGFGQRPGHVWAQDFADAAGATHPVVLESGEPDHYWSPGRDGSPDVKVMEADGARVEERHVQGPRTDNVPTIVPMPVAITEADLADVPPAWQPTGQILGYGVDSPGPVPSTVDTANTTLTPQEGTDDGQ